MLWADHPVPDGGLWCSSPLLAVYIPQITLVYVVSISSRFTAINMLTLLELQAILSTFLLGYLEPIPRGIGGIIQEYIVSYIFARGPVNDPSQPSITHPVVLVLTSVAAPSLVNLLLLPHIRSHL